MEYNERITYLEGGSFVEIPAMDETLLTHYANAINSQPVTKMVLWTIVVTEGEGCRHINKKKISERSGFSQKVIDNSISFLEGALMLQHMGVGTSNLYFLTHNGKQVVKLINKKGGFNQ